ncbi:hypothetical protein G7Y89_g13510 [Cudoniella acicularis]|uniref:Uncharacterized protein n=1 Tax=Cudoniella acicularis TaxID=354080 RepID=A0A8H4R7A8_9HELO|nr:hypothetical protein G7Y89_g13510 [Cudoniella acicularis]
MRFSYAARTELGDPEFYPYMSALESSIISPSAAANIRERISLTKTHNVSHYYSTPHSHSHPPDDDDPSANDQPSSPPTQEPPTS